LLTSGWIESKERKRGSEREREREREKKGKVQRLGHTHSKLLLPVLPCLLKFPESPKKAP
jgi:hypothetical protein